MRVSIPGVPGRRWFHRSRRRLRRAGRFGLMGSGPSRRGGESRFIAFGIALETVLGGLADGGVGDRLTHRSGRRAGTAASAPAPSPAAALTGALG